MTAQSMETIYIDGKKNWMASEPFNQYLEKMDNPPNLFSTNTACWRGYYGNWKIKVEKLYLTSLEAFVEVGDNIEVVGLDYFFPDQKVVLADWFSGELRVPMGEMIEYIHMGYHSKYEKDLIIHVENGVVISKIEINNK